MNKLFENFRHYLTEDIYSPETRTFIRTSRKLSSLDLHKKLKILQHYLETNFKRLGSGAFRTAYRSPSGEIIKIANSAGANPAYMDQPDAVKQNKMEVEKYNSAKDPVFPKIEETDPDYLWFIVEKVTPLNDLAPAIVLKKVFPKLFPLLDDYVGRRWRVDAQVPDLIDFVGSLLLFTKEAADKQKTFVRLHRNTDNLMRYSVADLTHFDNQEEHKAAMNAVYDYLKNPDENFLLLRKAANTYDVNPADFHQKNIGIGSDGKIKILDAGWV